MGEITFTFETGSCGIKDIDIKADSDQERKQAQKIIKNTLKSRCLKMPWPYQAACR